MLWRVRSRCSIWKVSWDNFRKWTEKYKMFYFFCLSLGCVSKNQKSMKLFTNKLHFICKCFSFVLHLPGLHKKYRNDPKTQTDLIPICPVCCCWFIPAASGSRCHIFSLNVLFVGSISIACWTFSLTLRHIFRFEIDWASDCSKCLLETQKSAFKMSLVL